MASEDQTIETVEDIKIGTYTDDSQAELSKRKLNDDDDLLADDTVVKKRKVAASVFPNAEGTSVNSNNNKPDSYDVTAAKRADDGEYSMKSGDVGDIEKEKVEATTRDLDKPVAATSNPSDIGEMQLVKGIKK